MSKQHDPSKAVRIRPLPPQAPQQHHWWEHAVPAWTVLSLLPVLAVAMGLALASVAAP